MLWLVPSAPWHTISNCADLNGFTVSEVSGVIVAFIMLTLYCPCLRTGPKQLSSIFAITLSFMELFLVCFDP